VRVDENQLFIVSLKVAEDENKLKGHSLHTVCGSAVELLATRHCGCCRFVWVQGEAGWKIHLLLAIECEESASSLERLRATNCQRQAGCRQKQHYEIALF